VSDCLHCDINEVVQEYIERSDPVDVMDVAAKMVESLVEVILLAPEKDQGKVLADVLAHFGQLFLEKCGAIEGGDTTH
jgi:hypothetical protein